MQVSKTKAEKVTLEEELKAARHAHVAERARVVFTHRDVALAADDRVHDAEIAMKLVRQRLQPEGERPRPTTATWGPRGTPRMAAHTARFNAPEEDAQSDGAEAAEQHMRTWMQARADDGIESLPFSSRDASSMQNPYDTPEARRTYMRVGGSSSVQLSPGVGAPIDQVSVSHDGSATHEHAVGEKYSRRRVEFSSFEARPVSPLLPERDSFRSPPA